jgi:twitching motility protein PilI
MAKKEALRELQGRLAERLQATRRHDDTASWLAVECAGTGVLLPLAQAGEISDLATLMPVPYTSPWFIGVANLRGRLHGVVDLGAFLGLRSPATAQAGREQSRLVAFNASFELNCALLVDRLAGLRSTDQLKVEPDNAVRPAFAGARYLDDQGRRWQELHLSALAVDEAFLRIAR